MWKNLFRTPLTWSFVAVFGLVAAVGLYWFQPWKLVTDTAVDEALPVVAGSPDAPSAPAASPAAQPPVSSTPGGQRPAGNQIIATGEFITHEHATTGTAQIVRLADGRQQLVLRDLDTSNGPDLRVWLTDQPVVEGPTGWRVFDDGEWVELAKLKGNRGDQVYDIPASVNPEDYRSVSIWCKRFSVSFGAAPLAAVRR